jgi:hypothetical protein
MSASALRYSAALTETLAAGADDGRVTGADCFGPMIFEATQPGYFWYGIHTAEMLYAVMGPGCIDVTVSSTPQHDIVVGRWDDGRIGALRGNRSGNYRFGAVIHRENGSAFADIAAHPRPFYSSLLERVIQFFQEKRTPLAIAESIEVIRFLEAANESKHTGKSVLL